MDIGAAFTFTFDDEDWIKKIAIGGGIALAGFITSFLVIGLVLFLPLTGYMLDVLKNVRDGRPLPLPEWTDFGELFKKGFFVSLIGLIYNLPVIIFGCIIGVVASLGAGALDPESAEGTITLVAYCMICIISIFSLLAFIILPAGIIRYAQSDSLASAFQFGEIFSFIRNNIGDYIIVVLLSLVAQTIANFGYILCGVGIFFTFFWSLLVTGHLYGQLARKAQGVF